jgi:hypothetical protein
MAYTILCVIALICVSGFIAYSGDLIGRRMGKKRLTLFHLRPRHTAIMVTTVTGMLISTLALVTLVSVNSQFRKVLLRGEQILLQNKQLTTANMDLANRSKALTVQVARQKRELKSALQDAVLAKKQRDTARLRVDSLRKEIATRQKELTDLRKQQDIAKGELAQRKDELALMLRDLKVADQSLRLAQSKLADAQQKLGATEAKLGATEAKLKDTTAKLVDVEYQGNLGTDMAIRLRVRDMAFKRGDELTRGIIKPDQKLFALRGDIISLLNLASGKAVGGHARAGENGRAVNLVYMPPSAKDVYDLKQKEPECVDLVAQDIASSKSDVLVQVVCAMNALPDAQVPVEMRLYVNQQVYISGDKIAAAKIDGRQSEGHILLALSDFIQTDVPKATSKAGVVPVSGQDPRDFLGRDRQAQADELLRVVAEIKSMGAMARVTIHATDNIWTMDSLDMHIIRFSVEKAE